MKIAIHNNLNVKGSFAEYWIEYCKKNNIQYKIVNAYDSDIIEQLSYCDAFMWHHSQVNYKDMLFAKQLLYSLEARGMKVFPNFNTGWHFDDKVGQKYLLEAIDAPLVPSYVFYTKKEALEWIDKTEFPKVWKLRGGAGSSNVKLARTKKDAKRFIRKAFGRGFPQLDRKGYAKERIRRWRSGQDKLGLLKAIYRLFITSEFDRMYHREKGYVYFQDFMPNNDHDIRVVVVGDKAFAHNRMVRKGDFRASGSGDEVYDKSQLDERCVKIAFDIYKKLKAQIVVYDFVYDIRKKPLIVEISYGTSAGGYVDCEGYWDENLNWYEGKGFDICGWMVEDLVKK